MIRINLLATQKASQSRAPIDPGQKIALGGKEWAEKVLRREDMQVYVYRLLLEYARLCDDNRERLGWMP